MGHPMDSTVIQIAAATGIAVVALFPSPSAMLDALDPRPNNPDVFFEGSPGGQTLKVEFTQVDMTTTRGIEIPALGACQYDLSLAEQAQVMACRDDLFQIATTPATGLAVDPDAEKARLALVRLCQAQWLSLPDEAVEQLPEACELLR